jgi:hypothetical protein
MGVLSTIAAVAAIGGKLIAGRKAKKASKAANAAQRAINKLKNKQNKRAFLRQFRQAQAEALVGGVAAGVDVESSTVAGVLAGQRTQARTAVGEFAEGERLGDVQTAAINRQASANFAASIFGSVASFAMSVGGGDFLDKIGSKIGLGK